MQTFKNKTLRTQMFHRIFLNIKKVLVEYKFNALYKRFHNKLPSHINPLISNVVTRTILGNFS